MILALDCASSVGSVALVRDTEPAEVVRSVTFATPRGRGGTLFSVLEEMLQEAGEIRRVVAGTGPGSYNGIRAGLAAAWGIATARGVPLTGVSSLLGLGDADEDYLAVGDARRGQFYFARVRQGHFEEVPGLYSEAEILRKIAAEGPSAESDGAKTRLYVPEPIAFLPQAVTEYPQAARLARRASGILPAQELPEPLYLKPAYITQASKGR